MNSHKVLPALLGILSLSFTSVPATGAGVPAKGTEILWDRYGVPHIFAPNHRSLFYAYAYAQMEAHSELLLRLYAQARGRSAEFYGDQRPRDTRGGQSFLESDRWVRTNGIPERAKTWASEQSPEFAPLLRAFVAGLNGWASEHPDLLSAPAKAVLPVSVEDVLAHGLRVVHYDWIVNENQIANRLRAATAEVHGSNGWAIAPARSASGHALLLSNSHLPWGDRHTYFEVQLQAPGVTSYGAVWIGFPTLRQCFTDWLGWTQTTNAPNEGDLYRLTLTGGGYMLDGEIRTFETEKQLIRVRQDDGSMREEPLTIRRTVHGPVVYDRAGTTVALRVAALDRPRMFEQFWKMGLAHNLVQFQNAMRMQQLPLFNTVYADRDGHILYAYNAAPPVRAKGDYGFWAGVVPGDQSALIWSKLHPYGELPQVIDPPNGFVQNCNDPPWTSTYPMLLDPSKFAPYLAPRSGITERAQRSIRLLSQSAKISFDDLKADKLSTRVEMADHFLDDLIAQARKLGGDQARKAVGILEQWDRQAEATSDGTLLFYRFMQEAGTDFRAIGGYAVPPDDRQPLTTPRGFADPAKAVQLLDSVAGSLERDYGSMHVLWGDALRFRRGALDLPGNGAPGQLGAIRTINPGPFVNGKAQAVGGDTYFAVIEFSNPVRAEALLGYGNWSRAGSKHVDDQLSLLSTKQMRPVWRTRKQIEANLENRKSF